MAAGRGKIKEASMDKIFVRKRRKVLEGEKKPRYRIVAATGNVKFFSKHARKQELEKIAADLGAEVVYLSDSGDGSGKGKK